MITISPRAFLFDFDGVIADTERLHMLMCLEVAGRSGYSFTEAEYFARYVGYDDALLFETVWKDNGGTAPEAGELARLTREKNALVMRGLDEKLAFYDGVSDFIQRLHGLGIGLAVVSGSLKEEILAGLDRGGLKEYFPIIVSAEMVRHGKPDPECYETAWEMLLESIPDLEKTDCWVLEDSPAGVAAAADADLNVIGITNSVTAARLARAHAVVSHVRDIALATPPSR